MVSSLYVVAVVAVLYTAVSNVRALWINIQKARKTGLPYITVPISPFNVAWKINCKWIIPLVQKLPRNWWKNWLFSMDPDWCFIYRQEPFERLGDTFVVVSPGTIVLFTQKPELISQVTSRREQFPKDSAIYAVLDIFGRNLLTTEGAVWRIHRKATSASFNEKNAAFTFAEAIHQTQSMLSKWNSMSSPTFTSIEKDTMTLALNIIAYVGFGLRFVWPGESFPADTNPRVRKYGSLTAPPGHSLTFSASVERVLHRIVLLLIFPPWLLHWLPFHAAQEAYEANDNYVQYMREFLDDTLETLRSSENGNDGGGSGSGSEGMDIMGSLVRSRYEENKQGSGRKGGSLGGGSGAGQLTDDEIIGNAFIMLVAGHETTANTLHFTLLFLAANPSAQRAMQADIDRLLGQDTDPKTWNYEANINNLLASMLGAVMNETLRLMPAVTNVPKHVTSPAGQVIHITDDEGGGSDRRSHVLPIGMDIILSAVSVHRHPRYWPPANGSGNNRDGFSTTDLDEYAPQRWFYNQNSSNDMDEKPVDGADTEDYGGFKGPDTSAQLFRPVRGSYVPFSDGPRSCLGRRIAQVEIIAALAVIFQRHSLELAVEDLDEGYDDAAVEAMDDDAKRALYGRARVRVDETLRTATSLLTLKLHGTSKVPVRLVPRGQERFLHIVDV